MRIQRLIASPLILTLCLPLNAQNPFGRRRSAPSSRDSNPRDGLQRTAVQLPVARVALYKNGVGFFEHAGRVTGDQSVTIDFTTLQLNDVLQSLTAIDLNGGRIAGANYNSTTPLEQQLRALPLALGQDPTPLDFYNSIRGARVAIRGPGGTVSGRLFNIEVKTVSTKDGPQERRVITVIGEDGGVRTAELAPTTEVRLLDPGLHQDLTRYLELLANNRNQGLRHLTLTDNGAGARDLRVSYISEVPIWKSTYRILFTDANTAGPSQMATLQGWSVIDNTTGADWINVQLSLIAGAPQSFIQPLSIPYYSRRPQIGLQIEGQTAPQLHQSGESSIQSGPGAIAGTVRDSSGAAIVHARLVATNTATGAQVARQSSGSGSFSISPLDPGAYSIVVTAPGFQRLLQQNVRVDGLQRVALDPRLSVGVSSQTVTVSDAPPSLETLNATLGGTIENDMYANLPLSMTGAPRGPAAFQYLTPGVQEGAPPIRVQRQGVYGGSGQTNLDENYVEGIPVSAAPPPPPDYEQAARDSLGASATASAFDDYFEYKISEPITIRKNESAMVPILQAKIDAQRVTLWSAQHPTPLRALWVTNTSKLTLDRGSFSIVEDGNFAGEGLLDPIHPAEKRLLSYAVDQAVRVSTDGRDTTTRVTAMTAAKGVVMLHHRELAEITYVIHNAASEPRTVVIEHPVRAGFTLDSDETAKPADAVGAASQTDAKPEERTPTLDRYTVLAAPGETVRLHVGEHRDSTVSYRLTGSSDSQLNVIVSEADHDKAAEQALQPIFEARAHVADMQSALDAVDGRLSALMQDEERQRENVTALASVDRSVRERFVHDLSATEDKIASTRKELAAAEDNLSAAQDNLAQKIEALQIDEKLWGAAE